MFWQTAIICLKISSCLKQLNTYLESLEYLYRKLRLRKANEKLSRLYVLDSLTGLYNRMAYQEFAEPLYEKCRLQKKPVTVMFIDADHLKYINDTFGHDMGNWNSWDSRWDS